MIGMDRTAMEPTPVITCAEVGSFPWSVLHDRHPALIAKVRSAYPFPAAIDAALADLIDEQLHRPMTALPDDAADAAQWSAWDAGRYVGRSWYDAPFLFAESYFYRRVLEATEYFRDGPWHLVDPFQPEKRKELAGAAVGAELTTLDRVTAPDVAALTRAAIWGNRADLVFLMADPTSLSRDAPGDLLIDDVAALWKAVGATPTRLGYVADNAGLELLHDLVLIDQVLARDLVRSVTLFLKPRPYFVSDATPADVDDCLARFAAGPPAAVAIAERLAGARSTGRLSIATDPMFCAPTSFARTALGSVFDDVDLTILKGDLNYRRLVGDRHWLGTESFADLTAFFPTPVAALRTVKSEVIVGMAADRLGALDRAEPGWRITGRHALAQGRLC